VASRRAELNSIIDKLGSEEAGLLEQWVNPHRAEKNTARTNFEDTQKRYPHANSQSASQRAALATSGDPRGATHRAQPCSHSCTAGLVTVIIDFEGAGGTEEINNYCVQ